MPDTDLADPRAWTVAGARSRSAGALHAAAGAAIDAPTRAEADAADADVRRTLDALLASGDGGALADALAQVPSPAIARHLRRELAAIERGEPEGSGALRTVLFAIPVIVVAALEGDGEPVTLPCILGDARALETTLRDARAFGGCEAFALAPVLCATAAVDVAALPELRLREHRIEVPGVSGLSALDVAPAPVEIRGVDERVHLRFLAGVVLAPPRTDPLRASTIAHWGMPLARAIGDALRAPGVSLLALPRPAARLVGAVQEGRAAQREVSAQIFASNAIRKFRAAYGEPTAIISAHRAADAAGGGELRLSLSSPFAPREAEGFRCPLYPYETVREVGAWLRELLADCRVTDVRVVPGVHPDIDAVTGAPLFFKNAGAGALH
jgi:hypothetical protein